ncbi:hypothetical protein, partial [Pseudomonas rhodesiae]|uniref:hypothetical protein n=1 Tax=Pseudomonas rhodesiae TaxID=76760 RepID=UPI001F46D701
MNDPLLSVHGYAPIFSENIDYQGGRGLAPDGGVKCAPKVGHLSNSWGFFMSKYTTQFKLSAITAFLERGRGFRR